MTSILLTLCALAVSGFCLQRLVKKNQKRRLAHGLDRLPENGLHTRLLWLLCVLPAVLLLLVGYVTAFIMWFAGISIVGWILAVLPPRTSKFHKSKYYKNDTGNEA